MLVGGVEILLENYYVNDILFNFFVFKFGCVRIGDEFLEVNGYVFGGKIYVEVLVIFRFLLVVVILVVVRKKNVNCVILECLNYEKKEKKKVNNNIVLLKKRRSVIEEVVSLSVIFRIFLFVIDVIKKVCLYVKFVK